MRVSCPTCGAQIPAQDVNISRMTAKCAACQAVFAFESQVRATPIAVAPTTTALGLATTVPLPAGIQLHREGPSELSSGDYRVAAGKLGRLRITRRWFSAQHLFTLFFAIVWNSFMVVWIAGAISQGGLTMLLFSIAHIALGVWVAYKALTALLNRTVIEIDRGRLTVRHGPIPAAGNRDVALDDLRQLFTTEIADSEGAPTCDLHAMVSNGPAITLVKELTDVRQALFIERAIEDHLEWVDQPVAGEVPK